MNKQELNELFEMVNVVYDNFIPNDENKRILKKRMWFELLKNYSYSQVQKAFYELSKNKIYGKEPKPADFFEILEPKLENQNLGIEFASDVWGWISHPGTDRMKELVIKKYGEVGQIIYERNRDLLRKAVTDDATSIKAQLRSEFNSMNERLEKTGTIGISMKKESDFLQIGDVLNGALPNLYD